MLSFSRRQLANYSVERFLAGDPLKNISQYLAAALTIAKKQKEADLLISDISLELEKRGLLADALVTTAHPLPESLRRDLADQIKKAAKVERVVINEEIDKSVIGGFRVETAGHTWDKTIARQLRDIKGGI